MPQRLYVSKTRGRFGCLGNERLVESVRIDEVIVSSETEEKLISKHGVYVYEVEELFQARPLIEFVEKGRLRGQNVYVALGQSEDGRYLGAFFINKGRGRALVISARDMDAKERKHYGKVRKK